MTRTTKALRDIPPQVVRDFCRQSAGLDPNHNGWPLATNPQEYIDAFAPRADLEDIKAAHDALSLFMQKVSQRDADREEYHKQLFASLYHALLDNISLSISLDDQTPHGFRIQVWLCENGEYESKECRAVNLALDDIDPLISSALPEDAPEERYVGFRERCLFKISNFVSDALDDQTYPADEGRLAEEYLGENRRLRIENERMREAFQLLETYPGPIPEFLRRRVCSVFRETDK